MIQQKNTETANRRNPVVPPASSVRILMVLITCSIASFSFSQNVKDSSLAFPMLQFSYAYQIPGADLARRFKHNSNIGLHCTFKTKHNLILGAGGSFLFGNGIRESGILDSIETSNGFVINQNGEPEVIRLFERGFTVSLYAGKLFPSLGKNKNSGLIVYGGPVFLEHKIKIYDVGKQAPQMVDPYPKGYDRLTAGFGAQEFIGYTYLGNNRILNFFAGLEFTQAFTRSQRSFDYDLRRTDTQKRTDLLYGIRAGWILPLYKKTTQQFYYE